MLPFKSQAYKRGWRLFEGGVYSRKYGTYTGAYIQWVPIFTWVLIHEKPLRAVEVGAYIHKLLILYGCLLSRVYGIA